MPPRPPPTSFADTTAARGVAALVLVLVVLSLMWLHREDLFPGEEAAITANPALASCIEERTGHVAAMLEDGVINMEQAEAFRSRAVQFCEQTIPAN